jgi:hypothetical protein
MLGFNFFLFWAQNCYKLPLIVAPVSCCYEIPKYCHRIPDRHVTYTAFERFDCVIKVDCVLPVIT